MVGHPHPPGVIACLAVLREGSDEKRKPWMDRSEEGAERSKPGRPHVEGWAKPREDPVAQQWEVRPGNGARGVRRLTGSGLPIFAWRLEMRCMCISQLCQEDQRHPLRIAEEGGGELATEQREPDGPENEVRSARRMQVRRAGETETGR